MPRTLRVDVGDVVYHILNRSTARLQIFETDEDYLAFEKNNNRSKGKISNAHFILLPNAESLAFGFVSKRRWTTGFVYAVVNYDAYA